MTGRAARDQIPRPALLVVEDDDEVRKLLSDLFEEDYQLLTARDGKEAFRVLTSTEPVAILLDLGLPDIDGREILTRLVRKSAPLPVIVVTARPDVPSAVECMKLGALDYFTKPFVLTDLMRSVQRAARLGSVRARDRAVLLIGGDRGEVAALTVLLETRIALRAVASAGEAIPLLVNFSPSVVVLFEPLDVAERHALFGSLSREHPAAGVLIVSGDPGDVPTSAINCPRMVGIIRSPCGMAELATRILRSASAELSAMLPVPIARSAEYVSRHYRQPCLLEDVAAYAGVSASHLAHLFHDAMGMTWRQFVARTRVELAKKLFADPRYTLAAVAELVGFCDAGHLSRVFRRRSGQSPGQFRQTGVWP